MRALPPPQPAAGSVALQPNVLTPAPRPHAPAGSLVSCAAFLSSTAARCKVVALEPARLVAFSWQVGSGGLGITWTRKCRSV